MAQFEPAVALVLRHEGGYVNDPNDPGGETKYGISKRAYPDLDIAGLSVEDAKAIYRRDYWDPLRLESVTIQDVANNILDAAVNTGLRRTVGQLQALLGVGTDGQVGPITLAAVNKAGAELNARICLVRIQFYTELARKDAGRRRYLMGWITRALSFR